MMIRKMLAMGAVVGLLSACAAADQNVAVVLTMDNAATAATKPADAYKLVWSDEFDKEGPLNPKDWVFENGFVRNNELQWYQEENAKCVGGNLVIEARREEKPNPRYKAGSTQWQTNREKIEYTSTSATTRGKHSWMYGRFEIKARINTESGSWPAFWMLGNQMPWPANGEIDIMEYYRDMVLANLCWQGANKTEWNSKHKMLNTFPKNWSDQFHVWRMDWDEKWVRLYCDDQLLNEQDLSKTIDKGKYEGTNPFHQPAYMILNLAIGGQNGGDPAKSTFPMKFEVEYVRVYQTVEQIAASAKKP